MQSETVGVTHEDAVPTREDLSLRVLEGFRFKIWIDKVLFLMMIVAINTMSACLGFTVIDTNINLKFFCKVCLPNTDLRILEKLS